MSGAATRSDQNADTQQTADVAAAGTQDRHDDYASDAANSSAAVNGTVSGTTGKRKLPAGMTPWKPGQSGNPSGKNGHEKYRDLRSLGITPAVAPMTLSQVGHEATTLLGLCISRLRTKAETRALTPEERTEAIAYVGQFQALEASRGQIIADLLKLQAAPPQQLLEAFNGKIPDELEAAANAELARRVAADAAKLPQPPKEEAK